MVHETNKELVFIAKYTAYAVSIDVCGTSPNLGA
jgi:hypothetical protein